MRYAVVGLALMTAACSGAVPADPLTHDAGSRDAGAARDGGAEILRDAGTLDSGTVDAGELDAGPRDGGALDSGARDGGDRDAGPRDAGPRDAGPRDAGPRDAGPRDAGPRDAGPRDAGPRDAGPRDAGPPDGGVPTHTVELRGVWNYAEIWDTGMSVSECYYNETLATGSCQFEVPHGQYLDLAASDDNLFLRACHFMSYTILCGTASCTLSYDSNQGEYISCFFPVVDDVVIAAHHIRSNSSALCTDLTCAELDYACGLDNFGTSCGTCPAGQLCFQSITASPFDPYFGVCIPNSCP